MKSEIDTENDGDWIHAGTCGDQIAIVLTRHEVGSFTVTLPPSKARQLIQQMLLALNKLEGEEK